ncbi:MAG: hypothetical protein JSV03_03450 [Planctomycetota bacterium]|nr:MAG: hypothetical protein JSV03_03450 [Planctomycetota bacterium]
MKSAGEDSQRRLSDYSRRTFLLGACGTAVGSSLLGCKASDSWFMFGALAPSSTEAPIELTGPAAKYTPVIKMTFVRRKGPYGIRWPGAIYDGEAALRNYLQQIKSTAKELGVELIIRPAPIYSPAQADEWVAEAQKEKPDGLLVVLLDRQEHSWPTAYKAIESKIPTVVFAPIGAAFTTNTRRIPDKTGSFICSTDDFSQTAYGMKMIKAGAKLREMRFIVIAGEKRMDRMIKHFGTKLRYLPAGTFLDEYNKTPIDNQVQLLATQYMRNATRISGPTRQDVLNGIKSYVVARNILKREQGDGITMDCLGALRSVKVSLPCIAWSKMLDRGIPAACEADLEACVTHALVQYLFDRPGFQQDPVPETASGCLVGSHCSCPTRLNGISQRPESYYLSHHHGMRDAVPRTMWQVGQRVTVADVLLSKKDDVPPSMIISAGTVVNNVSVPPSGGCVVAVTLKLDGVNELLDYPGFHQLFFYGDYKKELREYCQLFGIKPIVV